MILRNMEVKTKVKKDDTILFVNNQNYKGGKNNTRNDFQSQAKKWSSKTTSLMPLKLIGADEKLAQNVLSNLIEISTSTSRLEDGLLSKIVSNPTVGLAINTEKVLDSENYKKTNESIINDSKNISKLTQEIKINGIVHHEMAKDKASRLLYAKGQWNAINRRGKKVYSKSVLEQLETKSTCQKKPDVLNNWNLIKKISDKSNFNSLGTMAYSLTRFETINSTGFMPAYLNPSYNQCHDPAFINNINHEKTSSKTAKQKPVHISLVSRNEVQLNKTDNAWVPTAVKKATMLIDVTKYKDKNELNTEEINRNVQSILNKITPDNMILLTERLTALPINTIERLEKTIDLLFEKAIEEQNFASLYASLCSAMQSVQVSFEEGKRTTSFRKLIIYKCQNLFELDKAQEMDSAKKLEEINSCKNYNKKKELQLEYEENERRLRKRSVGNCRFIGELFKQKVLTPNIMLYCIMNLVCKHLEEPLECLCNLLKTIGKELEQFYDLNTTFDQLKALIDKKIESKIPSRIRFMIQDVIDLRKDNWSPRRLESKPKMIIEIENEAIIETTESSSHKQQRDHNRGANNKIRGGRIHNRRGGNDNNWCGFENTKYKQQNYTFDPYKLHGFKETVTTLVPSLKWSFPNSTGGQITNKYIRTDTLAALNDDKKSSVTSQIISNKITTAEKVIISEPEKRQSIMSEVAGKCAQENQPLNSESSSRTLKNIDTDIVDELDPMVANTIYLQCKNIIQEYEQMHNLDDVIYSLVEDKNSTIRTRHQEFVKTMLIITLDSGPTSRTETGKMLDELISQKKISITAVTKGIDSVLKDCDDYLMDYPKFFSYIAAIIAPLFISNTAFFEFIHLNDACISVCTNKSGIFFTEVLQNILHFNEMPNTKKWCGGGISWMYNKWKISKFIPLNMFISSIQINTFFKNDIINVFLLSVTLCDRIRLIDSNNSLFDLMYSWISTNINVEIIKHPQFVRALTISIIIACSKPNHMYKDSFFERDHVKLLTHYIGWSGIFPVSDIQAREVQCLYGCQIMSAALDYPRGILLKIFHELYRDRVVSKTSFDLWKREDELKFGFDEDFETKTCVAVVVLNSFFFILTTKKTKQPNNISYSHAIHQ